MLGRRIIALALGGLLCAEMAEAERSEAVVGGDLLVTGARLEESVNAPRDLLVSGAQLTLGGDVGDDLIAAGFSIDVEGAAGGDVTASGARVRLDGRVGGDATLSGFIVTLDDDAIVAGNARLFAGTATQSGAVEGALVVAASEVRLDGPVAGDVRIVARTLTFGPDARVGGRLMLALPEEIVVPPEVAPSGRVSYEFFEAGNWRNYDEMAWEGLPDGPSGAVLGSGFLLGLAFLLITAGTLLALMPGRVATMRRMALNRPAITVLIGAVGFSTLVGFIPVSAMTLVGLPVLPLAILLLLVAWLLGYLLGAYVVAMGIARALGLSDDPSVPVRLLVLAAAITVAALLNFIPILGWVLNLGLAFFGLGALTEGVLRALMPSVDPGGRDRMMRSEQGDQ